MTFSNRIISFCFILIVGLASCKKDDGPDLNFDNPYLDPDSLSGDSIYINPVFKPVLADPTITKYNGYFYAYGTEEDWGSEGGYHLVPVVRSKDLVNWEFVRNAFDDKPNWKQGGIWAPDVVQVNGQFVMYYSFSTWGDPNPGIGVATSPSPEGPFTDHGKLFDSDGIGVGNSIDPFYIENNGNKYLFWGSFQGIYAIRLSDDGMSTVGDKTHVGGNHLEASYVYRKDGYFYLFGSVGSCCDGANSTYHVVVGRSPSLLGPYLDKSGNNLLLPNFGELVVEANPGGLGFAGPGHNADIMTDDEGTDWFLYHAIPKNNPYMDNGASRRPLLLDKLIWEDGWPFIKNRVPSFVEKPAPVFNP